MPDAPICRPDRHPLHLAYRPDIDGLRALAILSVIGFHAFPDALTGGFVGVDVFFVISGFLISGLILAGLEAGNFGFAEFYGRRIRRIFPALILVCAACAVFGWFALMTDEYKQLGKHIAGGAGFIANFILWNESGYFDNAAQTKPLMHLWSLGIEEQFYLLWPLLLWVMWKKRFNYLTAILLIIAVSFAFNVYQVHRAAVNAFYSPFARFWELMLGSSLACIQFYDSAHRLNMNGVISRIFTERSRIFLRNAQSVLGFALIIFSVFFVRKEFSFPGWWALFPTMGAFLLIAAGPDGWLNRRILSTRLMVGIGLISYPLYLWHWPLLSFAQIIQSDNPAAAIRLALLAVSFVLAFLTYALIEKPIRAKGHGRIKVLALCLLMLAVGDFGAYVYAHDGIDSRSAVQYIKDNQKAAYPEYDDAACKAFIGDAHPLFPYCRYNDAGGKETIALIGDSHAHVAFAGLAEALAEKHINLLVLANSSCPPFLGAVTGENEHQRNECAARNRQMIQIILKKKNIRNVMITSRGAFYLSNSEFGKDAKISPQILFSEQPQLMPNKPTNKLFAVSLQKSVDALTAAGKKVYYILDWPELALDPAACLKRPFRFGVEDCSVPVDKVMERQKDYRETVQSVKGLTIIDPIPAFCPDGACQAFNDGKLLYMDNNHISPDGSRFLARKVLMQFLQFGE